MRVVFRTEANHKQGMGDLGGCLALSDACREPSDRALFLLSKGKEAVDILKRCKKKFIWVSDQWEEDIALRQFRPDVVVVNKLKNQARYVEFLKNRVPVVVTMDDDGIAAQRADLRINVLYPTARAITNFSYVALRDEFQREHARQRAIRPIVKELLILQGGADTRGFLPRLLSALKKLKVRPRCTVVLGPAFQHEKALRAALQGLPMPVRLLRNVKKMAPLLRAADLAVSAGGMTLFELLCVGTPSVVVCAEPFEVATATRLSRQGAVVSLGFGGDLDGNKLIQLLNDLAGDQERRQQLSLRGKSLIDGAGSERVMALIRSTVGKVLRRNV